MNAQFSKRTSLIALQMAVVLAVLTGGIASAVWLPGQRPVAGATGAQARMLVAQSATRITAIGSYRMSFDFAFEVKGGKTIKTTGTGLSDLNRNASSGQFEIPGFGRVEFRQLGSRGYIGLPGGRVDALGHHWIGIPAADSASLGAQDPLQFLRALSGDAEVENKGVETVAGVPTVRYAVRLDAQRLIAAAQAQGTVTTPIPAGVASQFNDAAVDVWLDDQNLPRRMRMSFGTDQISFRFQFEFADYGGTIVVKAPAPTDVTQSGTIQQAMQQLQAALQR